MTRLTVEGLYRKQGRSTAIDWRSAAPLEIAPGELLCLVGKSGAGKTSLARVIAGLDAPDEGEVRIDGALSTRVPAQDRGVAVIFENDGLWTHWNVSQNIAFGLRCRGLGRGARRARVEEVLAPLRLDGLGQRPVASLTALQRWRVALARGMVLDPKVMIIDEPFAAGSHDALTIAIADELRRVHAEHGLTMLVLTRFGPPCLPAADRIGVVGVGGLVQMGRPNELYSRPRSLDVGELFGPVTPIPGRLENVDPQGEAQVRTALGRLSGQCRPGTLAVGADVIMLARPENFVVPANSTFSNRFTAAVLRRRAEGPLCYVELRGLGDWTGTAALLRPAANGIGDGQSLPVAIPPDGLFVVPAAG